MALEDENKISRYRTLKDMFNSIITEDDKYDYITGTILISKYTKKQDELNSMLYSDIGMTYELKQNDQMQVYAKQINQLRKEKNN